MHEKWKAPAIELAANTALAAGLLSLYYGLAWFRPVAYLVFIAEDHWSEYATFVSWLIASLLIVHGIIRSRSMRNAGMILLAVVALFIAMEEISWGQRLFDIQVPEAIRKINRQDELSIHNLLPGAVYLSWLRPLLVFFTVAPFIVSSLSATAKRWIERVGVPVVSPVLWPLFALCVYLRGNQWVIEGVPLPLPWEPMELSLGIAVALLALRLSRRARLGESALGWAAVRATGIVFALIWALTAPLVRRDYTPVDQIRSAALGYFPEAGMDVQAAQLFDFLGPPRGWGHRNSDESDLELESATVSHAAVLRRAGRAEEAQALFERERQELQRLQAKYPDDPEPGQLEGILLLAFSHRAEAEERLGEALHLTEVGIRRVENPVERSRWYVMSIFLHEVLGQTRDAEDDLEALSALDLSSRAEKLVAKRQSRSWRAGRARAWLRRERRRHLRIERYNRKLGI